MPNAAQLLRDAKKSWNQIEVPKFNQRPPLPDGKYTVEVVGAEFKETKKKTGWGISWELEVLAGSCKGKKTNKWTSVLDEDGKVIGEERGSFMKKELSTIFGEDFEIENLEDSLGDVLGSRVPIQVRTTESGGKTYTNIYFQGLAKNIDPDNINTDESDDEEVEQEVERELRHTKKAKTKSRR